ncbi:hypothetical protein DTO027B5_723 [Paecilomyces variotii]|nr:hypothetical protein DTO169C6_493 [Paecilomyces variotii]KAJ9290075.1 hypothetical protein DTO021C3_2433 [Paecilomyces variotii]KAJ9329534.1 hypothetical protein DTO027B3_21 [Paecilomyces variotii]KAJ9337374.1 hypothetical protein DTO027B5_723 [Paecilomyces variotii]
MCDPGIELTENNKMREIQLPSATHRAKRSRRRENPLTDPRSQSLYTAAPLKSRISQWRRAMQQINGE